MLVSMRVSGKRWSRPRSSPAPERRAPRSAGTSTVWRRISGFSRLGSRTCSRPPGTSTRTASASTPSGASTWCSTSRMKTVRKLAGRKGKKAASATAKRAAGTAAAAKATLAGKRSRPTQRVRRARRRRFPPSPQPFSRNGLAAIAAKGASSAASLSAKPGEAVVQRKCAASACSKWRRWSSAKRASRMSATERVRHRLRRDSHAGSVRVLGVLEERAVGGRRGPEGGREVDAADADRVAQLEPAALRIEVGRRELDLIALRKDDRREREAVPARQVAQRAERRARPLPAGAGGCGVELLVHRGDGAVERRPTLLDRRRGGGSLLAEALPWVRAAKVDGRPAREQVELGVVGEPGEPGAGIQLVRQQPGGGHDRRVAVVVQAHTEDDRIGREGKPEALEEGDLGGRVVTRHAAVQHLGRRAALRGERALAEHGERIGLLEALAEDDRVAEHEEPAVVGCGPRRRLAAAAAEAVHAA